MRTSLKIVIGTIFIMLAFLILNRKQEIEFEKIADFKLNVGTSYTDKYKADWLNITNDGEAFYNDIKGYRDFVVFKDSANRKITHKIFNKDIDSFLAYHHYNTDKYYYARSLGYELDKPYYNCFSFNWHYFKENKKLYYYIKYDWKAEIHDAHVFIYRIPKDKLLCNKWPKHGG